MSKDRGFKKLVGQTITAVNAKCVNEVVITAGTRKFVIGAEVQPPGIPVISVTEREEAKSTEKPRGAKEKHPFPYPPENT